MCKCWENKKEKKKWLPAKNFWSIEGHVTKVVIQIVDLLILHKNRGIYSLVATKDDQVSAFNRETDAIKVRIAGS